MKKLIQATLISSFVLGQSFACDINGLTGYLPENDLHIGVNDKNANDMTEERFNEIIDLADKHYAPIVKEKGGKLKWSRGWNNGTVNASAQRTFWGTWKVNMYGGLARHELVTEDAFALVVCHELGHHLGGTPTNSFPNSWASVEGQSDYFGTLKCFRRIFESDDNMAIVRDMQVPEIVKTKCAENFTLANDVALCVRGSMAGMSLANLLGSLRGNSGFKFETPDTNVVDSTNSAHPAAQCRLDTYFQGALCGERYTDEVSNRDAIAGTCNRVEGDTQGIRPLCWYKPEN